MSTVVPFAQSPLKPYLGEWILDQISISRNKLSRLLLGEDGVTGYCHFLRAVSWDGARGGEARLKPDGRA